MWLLCSACPLPGNGLNKGFVCCGQTTFSGQLYAVSMCTIEELRLIVTRLVQVANQWGGQDELRVRVGSKERLPCPTPVRRMSV